MDQTVSLTTQKRDHIERLLSALDDGLYVVNSKGELLCVLQDVTKNKRTGSGMIAAIEAVIADGSALGRSILEKFANLRRSSDQVSADLDILSDRERDVLGLICEGHDDGEMSRALGLSRNTVRNHIASLYRKIGVNRRGAAIIWARERGVTCDEALQPRPRRRRPRATKH
jgi:DNA-binding NarL/FixJ family response regulator